jgi:hypothetical protein
LHREIGKYVKTLKYQHNINTRSSRFHHDWNTQIRTISVCALYLHSPYLIICIRKEVVDKPPVNGNFNCCPKSFYQMHTIQCCTKGYLKLTLSNAWVSDWQYMYFVWWTCFCTDSQHFYGYQPYFYSRPVVPLFVWTRHNVCVQRGGGMDSHGYEEQTIPNFRSFSHNNSKFEIVWIWVFQSWWNLELRVFILCWYFNVFTYFPISLCKILYIQNCRNEIRFLQSSQL